MNSAKIKNSFENHELMPILRAVEGPIDTFKIAPQMKQHLLDRVLETGSLEGVSFQDCPAFDDLKLKKIRQQAKVALEIQKIFSEDNAESILDTATINYANSVVWRASVVEAANKLRDPRNDNERVIAKKVLKQGLERLYPKINKEYASRALGVVFNNTTELEKTDDNREIYRLLIDEYPFLPDYSKFMPSVLNEQKETEIRNALIEKYSIPFKNLKEMFKELSNSNLVEATNEFLRQIGLQKANDSQTIKSGWVCLSDSRRDGFQVQPNKKIILCGKRKKEITWGSFEELMLHEVGVHVDRAQNGHDSGFQPLEIGLDGYNTVEEGLGILYEQVWRGKASQPAKISRDHYRYILAAYATGEYDGTTHNKNETFRFIYSLIIANTLATSTKEGVNQKVNSVKLNAMTEAFEHVFRAYRGMPEGYILTGDAAYFCGKEKLIEMINADSRSGAELVDYFSLGKFDPTNPQDMSVISEVYNPIRVRL